jgi:hypothetical protein
MMNKKKYGWTAELPQHKKPQGETAASAGTDGTAVSTIVPFNKPDFERHLVNFIAADDQVSFVYHQSFHIS